MKREREIVREENQKNKDGVSPQNAIEKFLQLFVQGMGNGS